MAKSQRRYTPEFRRQMVELHRAGHGFDVLAKQYGCTSWSIRQWVKKAAAWFAQESTATPKRSSDS
jgi:transposase-like protein